MEKFIMVAFGGALGATARYAFGRIPIKTDYPILTFAINLLGALLIGLVIGMGSNGKINEKWMIFWKTGVCGGFTTFSTFSSEALQLMESGKYLHAGAYIVLSVALCIVGVAVGKAAGSRLAFS